MENVRKHLDFIQAVVARLATYSLTLKGWAVTLVAALIALGGQGADKVGPNATLLALLPALAFWWLDAACLRRERLFRGLYDEARRRDETDFCMDVGHLKSAVGPTWRIALTSGNLLFYGLLALAAVAFRLLKLMGVA